MTNSVQLIAAYHKQGPKYQIPGGVRSLGCMTRRPGLIGEELHEQQRSKHAHLNLKERSRRSGLVALLLQMIDVLAAATYLSQALDPTIAVIVFVTVSLYIPMTIYITEWRGNLRREMNKADQVSFFGLGPLELVTGSWIMVWIHRPGLTGVAVSVMCLP